MRGLLRTCDQIYRTLPCCHNDGRDCRCYNCLHMSFYSSGPDTYNCHKKLCYYVMNYGPAYASEIYHYFSQSQILENNFNGKSLNIISLGCGFSPDLIALGKYLSDHNLAINVHYLGLDNEPLWNSLQINNPCAQYCLHDVISGFSLSGYDMVFINKLYSTLKKNNQDSKFLGLLSTQIRASLPADSFLIFTDINHRAMGRDEFNGSINNFFTQKHFYYYPVEDAYSGNFTAINQTQNVFCTPAGISVSPKPEVTKAIIFEYQK